MENKTKRHLRNEAYQKEEQEIAAAKLKYQAAVAPFYAEYMKATEPARLEHERVVKESEEKYIEVCRKFHAEMREKEKPAWAEFEKVFRPAEEARDKRLAEIDGMKEVDVDPIFRHAAELLINHGFVLGDFFPWPN